MNTDRIIYVKGYWDDAHPSDEFNGTCVIWGKEGSQSAEESSSPILADEKVFHYFEHDEDILGPHEDFVITAYEEEDGYIPS
jgi:hypothetical protein